MQTQPGSTAPASLKSGDRVRVHTRDGKHFDFDFDHVSAEGDVFGRHHEQVRASDIAMVERRSIDKARTTLLIVSLGVAVVVVLGFAAASAGFLATGSWREFAVPTCPKCDISYMPGEEHVCDTTRVGPWASAGVALAGAVFGALLGFMASAAGLCAWSPDDNLCGLPAVLAAPPGAAIGALVAVAAAKRRSRSRENDSGGQGP
jgi:hypothetical protein